MTGLATIPAADLPPQAYAHENEQRARLFVEDRSFWRPIENRTRAGWVKPDRLTGLWTATVTATDEDGSPIDSTWLEWMRSEDFGSPEKLVLTEVTPNPDARVLLIDSAAHLAAIITSQGGDPDSGMTFPDWEALAADGWDAVFLTDRGQWETRHSTPNLYGWDLESVLWLHPTFTVGRTSKSTREAMSRG